MRRNRQLLRKQGTKQTHIRNRCVLMNRFGQRYMPAQRKIAAGLISASIQAASKRLKPFDGAVSPGPYSMRIGTIRRPISISASEKAANSSRLENELLATPARKTQPS